MTLAIFLYGVVVFGIVCAALALIGWGIVNERRDRTSFAQGSEVFGAAGARSEAARAEKPGPG